MLRRRGERQQPAGVDKSQQEATATDNERDATRGGGAVGREAMARRQGMIMGGQRTRKKQQRNNQIGRPNNQTPTSANTGDWIRHEPATTTKQPCNNQPLQLLRVERKTMWKRRRRQKARAKEDDPIGSRRWVRRGRRRGRRRGWRQGRRRGQRGC